MLALIENPGFISEYSGFQNLKILAQIQKKIDDKKIVDTMRMVGLDPNEKKSFRKYSLGMKQKLGIAAAMMEDPQILVLDEPLMRWMKLHVKMSKNDFVRKSSR